MNDPANSILSFNYRKRLLNIFTMVDDNLNQPIARDRFLTGNSDDTLNIFISEKVDVATLIASIGYTASLYKHTDRVKLTCFFNNSKFNVIYSKHNEIDQWDLSELIYIWENNKNKEFLVFIDYHKNNVFYFRLRNHQQHASIEIVYNICYYTNAYINAIIHRINKSYLSYSQLGCFDYHSIISVNKAESEIIKEHLTYKEHYPPLDLKLEKGSNFNSIIVDDFREFTYSEFAYLTKQYEHQLLNLGIKKGVSICVFGGKSVHSICLFIALYKTRIPYIPFDLNTPKIRINYIINHSESEYFIKLSDDKPDIHIERIYHKKNIKPSKHYDDIAYIMYTSGTTGLPKGVAVGRKALLSFIHSISYAYKIVEQDRFLQFSSFNFDVSIFDIYVSISMGASLYLIHNEHKKNPDYLSSYIKDNAITVAEIPPALLKALKPFIKRLSSLRILSLGGEKFANEDIKPFLDIGIRVINGYGPTEATVAVSLYDCQDNCEDSPAIGIPMQHCSMAVVDKDMNLLPPGMPGELIIGGQSLAEGYLKDKELTNKKFISINYYNNESIYYRTGDLVRLRFDKHFEILGRIDRQFQKNGYRIEPQEIEKTILALPAVHQSHVVYSNSILYAFITAKQNFSLNDKIVFDYISSILPEYMHPDKIIIVDRIPLTDNGKIDFKTLISLQQTDSNRVESVSEGIKSIIQKEIPAFTDNNKDNIFLLGCNSLSSIKIVNEINNLYNTQLQTSDLYEHSTVASLIKYITCLNQSGPIDLKTLSAYLEQYWLYEIRSVENPEKIMIYFSCAGGNLYEASSVIDYIDNKTSIYSVNLPGRGSRESDQPIDCLFVLAKHIANEISSLFDKQALYFVGLSFGGLLAFETARQLEKTNVNLIGIDIISSRAPSRSINDKLSCILDDEEFIQTFFAKVRINMPEITYNRVQTIRAETIASEEYYLNNFHLASTVDVHFHFGLHDDLISSKDIDLWKPFVFRPKFFQYSAGHFVLSEKGRELVNNFTIVDKEELYVTKDVT